ncbi:SH3R2 ligase, partial [Oreotrochilus melanogaster]|nr:SH3R2 ligase [Oreotrochilus melanogaster]
MEDLALLDLLECPVCFEKLDATAKVLPCQHTFCKPCLQRILKSQKELRCPECRTLVLCSIEQLPSNLLLIRLLDGVRCGQNVTRFGSIQRSGVLSSPASLRRVPRGLQLHQHRLATNPRIHMEGVPRAKALYTYRGHNPGELRFNKGDTIVLLRQLDENWYLGELNGTSGVFPAGSVQVIKHLPLALPLGRALYSCDLRSRDKPQNKDNLMFHKVTAPCSRQGLPGRAWDAFCFRLRTPPEMCHPVSLCLFQTNTVARQLLQTSKSHWSPQFKSGSLRTGSPKAKGADPPAFPKVPDSRRKSPRQFSITTALNTLNRMVHAPAERQALEISSPVLISSSNPTVNTQSSEKAELPYGTPIQVSASYYPTPGSLGHSAAIVTLPHLQHHISAYMYVRKPRYLRGGVGVVMGAGPMAQAPSSSSPPLSTGVWLSIPTWLTDQRSWSCRREKGKSSLSDSKMPSLYASWTLSTSSLSSQGSISDSSPRQSRALKPVLLPVPIPAAGRGSAGAQTALRRGRGSTRRNGSLQRPGQAGTPLQVSGSLRRPPTGRPQQLQLYHPASAHPPGILAAAAMAEPGGRPSFCHDASQGPVGRGGESRTPSVCSSVILDTKDPPAKSEAAPKPPASAPPSILVKPETSRNGAEKQVKTVRFQNHSPPPPKRH